MKVIVYTDGSCLGNGKEDAPGGYGCVIIMKSNQKEIKRELSGGIRGTTNNRAELTAVIKTLETAKYKCNFEFHLDSKYVIGCATGNRINVNKDLWAQYAKARRRHGEVAFKYVPGHKGHIYNERANQLAQLAASKEAMKMAQENDKIHGEKDNVNHIIDQVNDKEIKNVLDETNYRRNE